MFSCWSRSKGSRRKEGEGCLAIPVGASQEPQQSWKRPASSQCGGHTSHHMTFSWKREIPMLNQHPRSEIPSESYFAFIHPISPLKICTQLEAQSIQGGQAPVHYRRMGCKPANMIASGQEESRDPEPLPHPPHSPLS